MLDWIFEGIATWVASVMTQIMDAISGVFIGALGTDMTAMEEYFPFAVSAYTIIQYTAWALLFLVAVWQIFRAFSGPLAETENPLAILARGAIFGFLIAYAKPIFSLALDIARAPYTALMDSTLDPGDFTFAGIEQALTNGLTTLVSVSTVVGLILLIILMIALAWNYFKLLLETVERYVLVGVLCYTSPLAYAMGASKATSRVFQSWCRMVGSQLLLLVLNVWFLRAFNSSVGQFIANGGALTNGQGNIFLWLFCALALLKIAQRCDSYLAAMGLSVAQTGSSMGNRDADGCPGADRLLQRRRRECRFRIRRGSAGRRRCCCRNGRRCRRRRDPVRLHEPIPAQQLCPRCRGGRREPDGRGRRRRLRGQGLRRHGGPQRGHADVKLHILCGHAATQRLRHHRRRDRRPQHSGLYAPAGGGSHGQYDLFRHPDHRRAHQYHRHRAGWAAGQGRPIQYRPA